MGKGSGQPLPSEVTLDKASPGIFVTQQFLLVPLVLPVSQLLSQGLRAHPDAWHCWGQGWHWRGWDPCGQAVPFRDSHLAALAGLTSSSTWASTAAELGN